MGLAAGLGPFLTGTFLLVDGAFFLANAVKIPYGGWLPLVMGAAIFIVLTTWKRGRTRLRDAMEHDPYRSTWCWIALKTCRAPRERRSTCPATRLGPVALLHNLKHNQILHERVVLLTVVVENAFRPARTADRIANGP